MLASLAAAYEAGVLKQVFDEFEVDWTIDDLSSGTGPENAVEFFELALKRSHWLTEDGKAVGPPQFKRSEDCG